MRAMSLASRWFGVGIWIVMMCGTLGIGSAHAALMDITDDTLPHFGDFPHTNSPGDYSHISKPFASDGDRGDFGWHFSPSNHGSAIGGILLGPNDYTVEELRIQVHLNPFKDFELQASKDTTTGFDGVWATLLSERITRRSELDVESWQVNSNEAYSAYRIHVLNDYTPRPQGWAVYRWELWATEQVAAQSVVPEPGTVVMLGIGWAGMLWKRRGTSC